MRRYLQSPATILVSAIQGHRLELKLQFPANNSPLVSCATDGLDAREEIPLGQFLWPKDVELRRTSLILAGLDWLDSSRFVGRYALSNVHVRRFDAIVDILPLA